MLAPSIVRPCHVAPAERERMLALHRQVFDNVRESTFLADLEAKDWVIVLRDAHGAIAGFSTIELISLHVDGQYPLFLFSGDTVVGKNHWHDSTLAGSFGHVMLRLIGDFPKRPIHWFLISKGYRTYRFLPTFFRTFYPAYDRLTPPETQTTLDAVATHKFAAEYNPRSGLINTGGRCDRLRPEYQEVPVRAGNDPHVAFFLERNPGFVDGTELACLAAISKENLKPAAWRVIDHTTVTWDETIGR